MRHIYLTKDAVSIVGNNHTSHWIQKHLDDKKENKNNENNISGEETESIKKSNNALTLSIERGPRVVRIISATARAAAMFPICALRPVSRCVLASEINETSRKRSMLENYSTEDMMLFHMSSSSVNASPSPPSVRRVIPLINCK
jgi:hypothetical protein